MINYSSTFRKYLQRISIYFFFVLIYVPTKAQENPLTQLRDQFTRYQENALQEKIFAHTSKDNFLAGETMFFKLYTVDGMLHRPLNLNTVAYIEMLNSSNQPVAQEKVSLENDGIGSGSLTIPDSLTTGRYRIIAYTSWMRNFSADYFFSKDISVINPLKKIIVSKKANNGKPVIQFFPEGGNLVSGLRSKVAFQVMGSNGQGLNATGVILAGSNDTVARFQPLKFGIGNFSFTPEKGKSYRAFIQTKEGPVIQELPVPYEEGYVMNLTPGTSEGELNVTIKSNKAGSAGTETYLLVHSRQRIRKLMTAVLDNSGQTVFTIPTQALEEGISHITLFDRDLKPLAERLYFKQPNQVLKINMDPVKPSYGKRDLVSVAIATQAPGNTSVPANLSLSVFKIDDIQGYDSTNIISYLLLTSDLKGSIENPFYYLTAGGNEKTQAIDNLMLTHGWSRFNWQDVLKSNWPITKFNPDHEGMTIRAALTNDSDAPVANANMFLSAPATDNQFYAAKSNSKGLLQFYTRNLYGKNEILLQQVGGKGKFSVTLISAFSENYPSHAFRPLTVPKEENLIRSYSIYRQVQKAFVTTTTASIPVDPIPFFGTPDKSYLLSDYVRFPQVKDVLKEYVPEIIVRKQDNKLHLFVFDQVNQVFFENEPFVLLDGVPVFDTDRIINMPADNIKKLDVVNRKFFYGLFIFNGIVSLTSDSSKLLDVQMNPEAMVFDFEGFQAHQEFYSPAYDQTGAGEERLPDFRNVLLWAPSINTDTNGKATVTFSTSDLPGKYIGVINGLTHNGLPGSATFRIEVK